MKAMLNGEPRVSKELLLIFLLLLCYIIFTTFHQQCNHTPNMNLPLPQWVAYIFCIPSSTLSFPYDSHSRSSASYHLNQFSHSLMDAISSCHKNGGKYQCTGTETRWRFCLKWSLAERRAAFVMLQWIHSRNLPILVRFTHKETRQKRIRNPGKQTIAAASRCLQSLKLWGESHLCSFVFTMKPRAPVPSSSTYMVRRWSQSKRDALGVSGIV